MRKGLSRNIFAIMLACSAVLLFSSCGEAKNLELSGTIESTQVDAFSEASGKIIKLDKEEGDPVKQGDVIAELDGRLQELAVKQQEAVVKLKAAKLDELKAGTRPQQLDQAEAAAKSAALAVKNADTGVDTAQTSYDYVLEKYNNIKALYDSKSASENDLLDAKYKVDTAGQQLDVAKKQLESARAQLESANAQLDLLKKGSTSQTIQAAEADLEQSQAALEQAKLTLEKYKVKAPMDGTLITKNAELGELINTGASAGTVSDLGNLWMYVYIQQKYLNRIALDQELYLRVKALDGSLVKGKIVFISGSAEFTPKNAETDEARENTVFKVKIKILERVDELRPGMTADAIIPLGG
jgi:HlyD family secretion protein